MTMLTLARLFAELAVFLESHGEDKIDQDVSVDASELMAFSLRDLTDEEMADFCATIRQIAVAEYSGEARDFVLSIPEVYNLEPHPDDLVDDDDEGGDDDPASSTR